MIRHLPTAIPPQPFVRANVRRQSHPGTIQSIRPVSEWEQRCRWLERMAKAGYDVNIVLRLEDYISVQVHDPDGFVTVLMDDMVTLTGNCDKTIRKQFTALVDAKRIERAYDTELVDGTPHTHLKVKPTPQFYHPQWEALPRKIRKVYERKPKPSPVACTHCGSVHSKLVCADCGQDWESGIAGENATDDLNLIPVPEFNSLTPQAHQNAVAELNSGTAHGWMDGEKNAVLSDLDSLEETSPIENDPSIHRRHITPSEPLREFLRTHEITGPKQLTCCEKITEWGWSLDDVTWLFTKCESDFNSGLAENVHGLFVKRVELGILPARPRERVATQYRMTEEMATAARAWGRPGDVDLETPAAEYPGSVEAEEDMSFLERWQQILSELASRLPRSVYDTHFAHSHPIEGSKERLVIAVERESSLEWIEKRFQRMVQEVALVVMGQAIEIEFCVGGGRVSRREGENVVRFPIADNGKPEYNVVKRDGERSMLLSDYALQMELGRQVAELLQFIANSPEGVGTVTLAYNRGQLDLDYTVTRARRMQVDLRTKRRDRVTQTE